MTLIRLITKDTTANFEHIVDANGHRLWFHLRVWCDVFGVTAGWIRQVHSYCDAGEEDDHERGDTARYTVRCSETDLLMISACSSIKLPSPITMGPASAIIRAFGWTTVLGPEEEQRTASRAQTEV